jgi:hypothetical protein
MRVLVSPAAEFDKRGGRLASVLAGPEGSIVSLAEAGVRSLWRPQSQAEVHAIRRALLGLGPGEPMRPRPAADRPVAYVCVGRSVVSEAGPAVFVVTDHVNLTWWSPLRGQNDATCGPRFPVMAGLYRPEMVEERLPGDDRGAGIVAQVTRSDGISGHEAWAMQALGLTVATVELAPVAILAAHLGYGLATVVVVE